MLNYPKGLSHPTRSSVKKAEKADLTKLSNRAIVRKRKKGTTKTKFGKRGMNFEAAINATNDYYLAHGLAVVHKKPTPIQIVKVDYPKRSRAKITEAYFKQASTTDYSGAWNGHYLDFEAKETQQKTVFPMKNFHAHQIQHMENVLAQKGIVFVLLHFAVLEETYFLPSSKLVAFYHEKQGLKSIPIAYIKKYGFRIPTHQIPMIPYLDVIKRLNEVHQD